MQIKTIIITVLLTLFTIILIQNTTIVTFQLLFWQVSTSLIILMIIMLLIGYLIGLFSRALFKKRKKQENKQTETSEI